MSDGSHDEARATADTPAETTPPAEAASPRTIPRVPDTAFSSLSMLNIPITPLRFTAVWTVVGLSQLALHTVGPYGQRARGDVYFSLENPLFKTFLLTSTIVLVKMLLAGFYTVSSAVSNNSTAESPEDFNTGDVRFPPMKLEDDHEQARRRRILQNDNEIVPAAVLLAFLMLLTVPNQQAARVFMWSFVFSRCMYTIWYANGGSHFGRFLFHTLGVWAVIGYVFQIMQFVIHA